MLNIFKNKGDKMFEIKFDKDQGYQTIAPLEVVKPGLNNKPVEVLGEPFNLLELFKAGIASLLEWLSDLFSPAEPKMESFSLASNGSGANSVESAAAKKARLEECEAIYTAAMGRTPATVAPPKEELKKNAPVDLYKQFVEELFQKPVALYAEVIKAIDVVQHREDYYSVSSDLSRLREDVIVFRQRYESRFDQYLLDNLNVKAVLDEHLSRLKDK